MAALFWMQHMTAFDEAWLREHQGRMAKAKRQLPASFGFTLPYILKAPNVMLRMHWAKRSKYVKELSAAVDRLTTDLPIGAPPLETALVTVTRYCLTELDTDAIAASCKSLLDVLQPRSERHPHGLGFIVNDNPLHLSLIARQLKVTKRAEQRTVVLIERV